MRHHYLHRSLAAFAKQYNTFRCYSHGYLEYLVIHMLHWNICFKIGCIRIGDCCIFIVTVRMWAQIQVDQLPHTWGWHKKVETVE